MYTFPTIRSAKYLGVTGTILSNIFKTEKSYVKKYFLNVIKYEYVIMVIN